MEARGESTYEEKGLIEIEMDVQGKTKPSKIASISCQSSFCYIMNQSKRKMIIIQVWWV